ncbi:jg7984 [Pararge aegeria aegeria]|uniref:Jg7984 protein n=1 Tax=Pararge aegeria aegeria TaxID=348720 RepID=A0A8S4SKZ9_9NEOP|nr:jg7984 [Pararge aegeria aegeria]
MGGAHSSMDVRVPRCWSGNPAPVNAALVEPESRGAAGYKRPRMVEFRTPYKRPVQQWTSIGCLYDDDDDSSRSQFMSIYYLLVRH